MVPGFHLAAVGDADGPGVDGTDVQGGPVAPGVDPKDLQVVRGDVTRI